MSAAPGTCTRLLICIIILWSIHPATIDGTKVPSYNQPRFCPNATWNLNGITFADKTQVGNKPYALFVDRNNTVYVINHEGKKLLMWRNSSTTPKEFDSDNFKDSYTAFVTTNGDIFIYPNKNGKEVVKWVPSTNITVSVMNVEEKCYGLFVDLNDTLYCSMSQKNKIVKSWLNDTTRTPNLAAGTGSKGSNPNELDSPAGIFVDVNFNLYVADEKNNRIQLFKQGQLEGITVAGNRSQNFTIELYKPAGVVLDADKYLFIVDSGNARIVGSGLHGFRCVVGCSGQGSQLNQLVEPYILSFDIHGNIFVNDYKNSRIQKFTLITDLCEQTTSATELTTLTTTTTAAAATTVTKPTTSSSLEELPRSTANTERTSTDGNPQLNVTNASTPAESPSTIVMETRSMALSTPTTSILDTVPPTLKAVTDDERHSSVSSLSTVEISSSATSHQGGTRTTAAENNHAVSSSSSAFVVVNSCPPSKLGINCSLSSALCHSLKPCLNGGICTDTNTNQDYKCTCSTGFTGKHCETNLRPCKEDTCLNGACHETTPNCTCTPGWRGVRCEQRINYCENVTCHNDGLCRLSSLNYTCDCLAGSYSGRHCEVVATRIVVYQFVSKSFAYVVIIVMTVVLLFVIVMDVLKYGFGIDATREELRRLRQEKRAKRRVTVIQRFAYVDAPRPSSRSREPNRV